MPNVTRRDLIAAVSGRTGLSKVDATAIFNGLIKSISDYLTAGRTIEIRKFGRFKVKPRRARRSRNPATGGSIMVPAGAKPMFKASRILINKLNPAA